jgi:hypothetical protein
VAHTAIGRDNHRDSFNAEEVGGEQGLIVLSTIAGCFGGERIKGIFISALSVSRWSLAQYKALASRLDSSPRAGITMNLKV